MNSNKRYPSLQTIMSLGMVAVGIVASGFTSFFIYNSYRNQVKEDLRHRLVNIADVIALQLEPEKLSTIVGEDSMQGEAYLGYQNFLFDVIDKENDIRFIYTMQRADDGTIYFYLDATSDEPRDVYEAAVPGTFAYEQPSDLLIATFNSPDRTVAEEDVYIDEYGALISAYTPLFNADGTLNSILGVDIAADTIIAQEMAVRNQTLLYFLASIPLAALIGLWLGKRLSNPTITLTKAADEIASGNIQLITSLPSPSRETHQLMLSFNTMVSRLKELIGNLEEGIKARTTQLETAGSRATRRASQFEAIAQVGRTISSARDLDILLPRIVASISQQLDFYHVGIFLIDAQNEFAVLRAANSDGGLRMLQNGHKLKIGEQGVVGFVAQTGQARIALDVGSDAVYFDNPDLPETHSEVSLPLKIEEEILGVLDIQSKATNAFSSDDISSFLVLADQVSIAIQNALTFEQAQRAIRDAETASSQMVEQAWSKFTETLSTKGYHYDGIKPEPLKKISKALEDQGTVAVPIQLRSQTIGRLKFKTSDTSRKLSEDEIAIIQSTAERVALAVESARLLEEAQRRATRETIISEISSKLGASFKLDSILRDTVEELGQTLKGSTVTFQLVNPSAPPTEEKSE